MCRIRHINDSVLSSLKMEGIRLLFLDLITQIMFGEEYKSFSSSFVVFFTPLLPHPSRPKYSPQHPILKHPQPTYLSQCE
jgi:hypothetical protein